MDAATFISALDDYGFTDTAQATKLRALNGAIWQIDRLRPWPYLEESINLNFAGGSATASNSPANLRAVLTLKTTDTHRRLTPMRLEDVESTITDLTQAGTPRFYYFDGGALNFWPLPPAGTGTVRLRYLKTSTAITGSSPESDILLPARHHDAILYGALIRLYDMEDDPELAIRFEGHLDRAVAEMVEDLFKQQYDRTDFIQVMDYDDDWHI